MATDALRNIRVRLEKAAKILGTKEMPDWLLDYVTGFDQRLSSDLMSKVTDPANPEQRVYKKFKLVRVWHRKSDPSDIWKGGMRYDENVTLSQMEGHAMEMFVKEKIHQLPLSGAKGGVAVDPHQLNKDDLKELTEKVVARLVKAGIMSPYIDVIGPDMGTGEEIMDWMRDHYIKNHANTLDNDGVVTGKSVSKGGIYGRKAATGIGLHFALQTFLNERAVSLPKKPTAIILGFGNVGSYFARLAAELSKMTVIAVVDKYGGVYSNKGLDVEAMNNYAESNQHRTICGFEAVSPDCAKITFEEMILLNADVFVPAAAEESITPEIAEKLKQKIVLEGANGPTLAEADSVLRQRKIEVIPDIYANAGGVIVSYFEWARNVRKTEPANPVLKIPDNNEEAVKYQLKRLFDLNGKDLIAMARKYNIPYREAGYALAMKRASADMKASF